MYPEVMPEIRIVSGPDDTPDYVEDGGFGDVLFQPLAPPEPDPDLTPEEERWMTFRDAAMTGYGQALIASAQWEEPTVGRDNVCVFGGWPRRHMQVGRNCPHGMIETLEMHGDSDDSA